MPDLWMDVDIALSDVPVNIMPLLDATDFKTIEDAVVFNQAGMDLVFNFIDTQGGLTQTAITPASTGNYLWGDQGNGIYTLQIPASGGASINNNTEGFGWFTGFATGILPWRGPTIGFRAAGLNNLLIDDAFSATRGLAGTALPAVAAEAAGGLYTRGSGAGQINQQANGQVDANLERMLNGAQSATDLKDFADDGYDPATNKVEGVKLVDVLTTYTGNTPQTGDVFPLASTEIADIKAKTDQLVFTTANRVDSTVVDKTGFSLSVSGIAAIWDALLTGITTVGSIGRLIKDNLDALISSRATPAQVNTEATNALNTYDPPTSAELITEINSVQTDVAAVKADTAATLVDTAEMQGKLPTNKIMGSSTAADKDDEIDAIKVQTDKFVFTNAGKVDAAVLAAGDFAQAAADKVWASAARTLTSFGTLVADVATSVWAAVSRTITGTVTVGTNNDKTGYALSSAGVDAIHDDDVETGLTFREEARISAAANSGKTNGALGPTFNIRNIADTKNRVQATVDADGNRTAITRDLT